MKLSEFKGSNSSPKTVRIDTDMPFKPAIDRALQFQRRMTEDKKQPHTARLPRESEDEMKLQDFEILEKDEYELN